jgi:hypothetical protein
MGQLVHRLPYPTRLGDIPTLEKSIGWGQNIKIP